MKTRNSEIRKRDGRVVGFKDDLKLPLNAVEVLKRRYLLKDELGKVVEIPGQMFERVAKAIARAELNYGKSKEEVKEIERRFYLLMRNLEFLPNSPTLMNAGTELGQLAACFVLPVEDSMEGIFGAVKNMALIHQCLVPETLVMTDKGLKRLEEVDEGDEIATHEGYFEVGEVHNNGRQKVFEVITEHGYSLVGTKEHKLRVVNKKGEHEWREIKDLEEGDWLILKPGGWSADTDSDDLPSFEFKPKKGRNETSFKPYIHNLPDTVTPELAELIGLYIGDGSNHRDGIRFSVNKDEPEILERIKWLSRKLFGKEVVVPEDKKRTWEAEILSKQIKEWFNFLQITKQSSKKVTIPSVILNGSREVAYSFLRGLFSADGCIRESGHIVFSTASERLARELQVVMFYLGIPTRKTHYKRAYSKQYPELKDIYQIALCNKSGYSIFKENIGFLVHCKKKRLDNVGLSSIFTRGEHIPYQGFALKHWYSTLSREEKRRVRPLYSDIMHRRSKPRHLSYQKVERVVKEGELVPPFFHDLLRNNFFYSEVESIRPKAPREVYDLTIPYKHAYIANGFVSHNSGGGTGFSFSRLRPKGDVVKSTGGIASGPVSFMRVFDVATDVIKQGGKRRGANMGILNAEHPDILEFIRAKERGEFANFNTSVAVTDEFMRAVERNDEYGLVNPRTKEEVKRIKAREVFNEIVTYAWKTGDPGIVFMDEINRRNPISAIGRIEATNPCVTADTWVMTAEGPRQIEELIGKKFVAMVNGEEWESSEAGFFETGVKQVYRLKTAEGFELRLTADHPVMKVERTTRYKVETQWSNAGDLKPGDKIIINNHRDFGNWSVKGKYTEEEGYLIGLLLGDGTIKEDKVILSSWGDSEGVKAVRSVVYEYAQFLPHRSDFGGWTAVKGRTEYRLSMGYLKRLAKELELNPGMKAISKKMEKASADFCEGLLRGLFDADGSVQGNQSKGVSIRLAQSDLDILKAVQQMLLRFGIFSRIYMNRRGERKVKMPDGKGGIKEYITKPQHELVISKENILYFAEKIGFDDSEKMEKLENAIRNYKRKMNRERFVATVKEVVPDGIEKVYDVQIPGINAFDANGFVVHNCGEQPLLPYDSCNLGSINVSKFVKNGEIDWERLREAVWLCVRFLDDVIDVNRYPLPEIEKMTKANRKIGLGIMGFAELLIKLGIAYDSKDAFSMAEKLMQFITNEARQCSRELGLEKASFPNFELSGWSASEAMRNATVTTIAPTGTISIIAGCSSGIEPLFAVAFIRNVMGGMLEINKLFEEIAKERGFYSKDLITGIAKCGSVQDIKSIPSDVKRVFVTALDIAPEWHVRLQAAFQKYTDNAVSKTVNLPADATWEDVKKVFLLAYNLKCKGITVYRYGSKEQVLSLEVPKLMLEEYVCADSEYTGECRICSV